MARNDDAVYVGHMLDMTRMEARLSTWVESYEVDKTRRQCDKNRDVLSRRRRDSLWRFSVGTCDGFSPKYAS